MRSDADVCIVCQYPCRTRACTCSHMHAECAVEFCRHFDGRCTICQQPIRTAWLEKRPRPTRVDRDLADRQRAVRRHKENAQIHTMRKWQTRVWPALVRVFKKYPRNLHVALTSIELPEYSQAFAQRYMDEGGDARNVDGVVRSLLWLRDNYDIVTPRVKRAMRAALRQSYVDYRRTAREEEVCDF